MNYKEIHDLIIYRAMQREPLVNGERHHILPRCEGGTNSSENLVKLSFKEHKIIHLLLAKLYPNNEGLKYAANLFAGKKIYRTCWNKGKTGIYTAKTRALISASKLGRKLTLEHREKIRSSSVNDRAINVFTVNRVQFRKPGQPSIYEKGKLIARYTGLSKAARELKIPYQWISRVLNGSRKQCKGMTFEYAE